VPTSKEFAVLVACERVIRTWPVDARIAFREAVLRDVAAFVPGQWDLGTALVAAEIFGARWALGLPWPPTSEELKGEPVHDVDLAAVALLARRIRAIGIELALVCATDPKPV
jgi:hypothetical protein